MSENGIYLEITEGENKGVCYRLKNDVALMGRAAECDIRLDGVRGVSRNHCRLYLTDQGLRVQDLESQNGVIVQGKRIRDAIISPGVSFKVGEAEFTVRNTAALPVAAGSTQVAATVSGDGTAVAQQAGFDGAGIERASEAMELAGEKSRNVLLQLLVLVALVVAGLYSMQMFSMRPPSPPIFAVVRKYEKRVIDFRCDFDNYKINSKSASGGSRVIQLYEYNGLLAATLNQLYEENPNIIRRRMMIVVGEENGDAWVGLSRKGRSLGKFLIVCRGVDPFYIPESMSADEARSLAVRAYNEAKSFEADGKEYDAWRHYEIAAKYYNSHTDDVNRGSEALNESLRLKSKLQDKVNRLFIEAITMAFPAQRSIRKSNYSEALLLLDQAKLIFPDEGSPDRQFVDNWYSIIQRLEHNRRRR